jgi:hypothetical protein
MAVLFLAVRGLEPGFPERDFRGIPAVRLTRQNLRGETYRWLAQGVKRRAQAIRAAWG